MIAITRNSAAKLAILLASLGLTAGCVIIEKPLSDPTISEVDEDLCGIWKQADAGEVYLFVGKTDVKGNPPMMRAIRVDYASGSNKIFTHFDAYFSVTKLGVETYANVFCVGLSMPSLAAEGSYQSWRQTPGAAINLMKYELRRGQLTLWQHQNDDVTRSLESAKKKGEISTSSPLSVVRYLRNDSARLFPDGKGSVYTRVSK